MNSLVIYHRSFIFRSKVGSILCFSYSYANILTAFWFLTCAYLKKWGWTFCSLLVTFYSLLVARYFLLLSRCSLLFTRCSLLVTFYSLLVARYFLLVARYFLLVARRSLLFARCSFAYCEPRKNGLAITKLRHKSCPWDFCNFFWMVVFKVFSKPFSKLV